LRFRRQSLSFALGGHYSHDRNIQFSPVAVSISRMNFYTTALIGAFAATLTVTRLPAAETVQIVSFPSNQWWRSEIRLHVPAKPPVGLLVFLPAGDIHSFSQAQFPKMLATNDVMTLIAAPQRDGLYTGDAILTELDGLVSDVVARYQIPSGRVTIGGFSAGGIGAVRYAQFCLKGDRKANSPQAVFAVDSPLDYERWFLAAELYLGRLALAGRDFAEDRSVTNELRQAFGGSPTEALDAYRRQSPVSTRVADGGNARLLRNTPIRLYIEPDIKWRLENWNRDAYSFNLIDATVLINVLRLLGNQDAELITTSGAGQRPDGSRNPHSWSIVDECALTQWLTDRLRTPKSE
jgi:hypothetical protein